MTLPASPPITLAQVRAEFGAPAGTPLHAFVRGGAWVPDTPTNAGVPTAVPISLHQLCGASKTTVTASASPSSVSGSRSTSGLATTNTTTATLSGATATGFSWKWVSGDTTTTCNGSTSATASFSAMVSSQKFEADSVWECTITYSGGSVVTNTVSARLSYIG